jgi:hypothetical protein
MGTEREGQAMKKPVSMTAAAQAVADAARVARAGLGGEPPEVRAVVYREVLREFLDYEYVRDLRHDWQSAAAGEPS